MVKDTHGVVDDLELGLHSGDVVLLFTDGVTEATAPSGEMYGQDRLAAALERLANQPLEAALEGLLQDVRAFAAQQDDDITLMLIRRA
jgi:phosphoserine phosphatase RsbU/P